MRLAAHPVVAMIGLGGWKVNPLFPPAGMALPEGVVLAFAHVPEAALGDLADQILGQGLVVGNPEEVLGRLALFQFLAERVQARRGRREVEVGLVRGKGEQESGFHEEGGAPFERFLGFRRESIVE